MTIIKRCPQCNNELMISTEEIFDKGGYPTARCVCKAEFALTKRPTQSPPVEQKPASPPPAPVPVQKKDK